MQAFQKQTMKGKRMSDIEWNAKMQRDEKRRAFAAKFTMANGRYPTADEYPTS